MTDAGQASGEAARDGSVRMGRWIVSAVPAGWWFDPAFGLKQNTTQEPAANITVVEDVLLSGNKLEPYITVQKKVLEGRYEGLAYAGPQPSALLEGRSDVDEAMMLLVQHPAQGNRHGAALLQVQTYVRSAQWLGIITLTSTQGAVGTVRRDYEQFVRSLRIAPAPEPSPAGGAA